MLLHALDVQVSQDEFGVLIGVSQQRVSALLKDQVIAPGGTAREWLSGYVGRLREQVESRQSGEIGGLDLVQERAALAREQRKGYALKNAKAHALVAPRALLEEVLRIVSSSIAAKFEGLRSQLKVSAADLPPEVQEQIDVTIDAARAEWVRQTSRLADDESGAETDDDERADADPFGDDD